MSSLSEVPSQQEQPAPSGAPAEQEVHLAEYWAVIVKRRRLIGICVAVALLIGALISLISPSTYKATTVLDVEKEKGSPLDISSMPTVYSAYDPEFLPTQTKLMKSREVAQRVVERLNLVQNDELNPPKKGLFGGDAASASNDVVPRIATNIQKEVDIVPIRGTNLVELSFVAKSPKLAADVANAVADSYIDWNLESKFQVVAQASQFLAGQIEQLKSEMDQKEQQLQAYGRQKDIVSTDPQSNVTTQRLESLNKDYADAVADRVAKEAKYHEVQTVRPETIADTLSNGLVSQLRNDQARLEREYAEKLNLFKPEWPAMLQLKAQIDKGHQHLDSVIQETVAKARDVGRNDYMTALRREESLKAVLQGQKSEAMTLNTNAVEYNNLKVEVETKRTLLDTLLKRNAETQVTSRLRGERLSNVRVVDRALPPRTRFRPSYKLNGMLALFLGGALGVGVAFLLEYLDRSLRTPEQVERILKLPSLGVIPSTRSSGRGYGYGYGYVKRLKRKNPETGKEEDTPIELLPHYQQRSTVAEAYRAFRTALLLSRAGGVKSIAITSTLPGEGKTATAINLAVVLAQLGKRVLVVAADLHKARIHEVFQISNRVGLVSVLAENVQPGEAIVKISNIPGLFVMPSGPASPNPSALLASDTMTRFMQFAVAKFDHVILDTPPVGPVADALIIGNQCDGSVIIVKGGVTPREQVARTRDKLERSNVRILGVLINKLEEDTPGYGKYYSYYGKAYGDTASTADPKTAAARVS
jgi:succinoglycan biosynthesis transport protein ExoP